MRALLIVEAKNQTINDCLYTLINAASLITTQIDVLVIGAAKLDKITNLEPIKALYQITNLTDLENIPNKIVAGLKDLVLNYSHVLMASNNYGKNLLPALAASLDYGQISEVIQVISPNIFKIPMYAGNIIAEIESLEDIKFLTIRTSSFSNRIKYQDQALSVNLLNNFALTKAPISKLNETLLAHDNIDLTHARVIVSGGRALGSQENFDSLIVELAKKLGGAPGATRACVEAGFAPNEIQVGQTGKIVAPDLYLACGISGAVQHIAGIKNSKTVLAINIDANAQIFEYADYGYVGDLFEVLPQLISQ